MIEYRGNELHVASATDGWSSMHAADLFGGPRSLWLGDDLVLHDDGLYIDDMAADSAVVERTRGHEKAAGDRVESCAHFPFGGRIRLAQTCVYGANHVRVNFDLNWPPAMAVNRHLGIQRLTLPGPWRRFFVVPPASRSSGGALARWHAVQPELETASAMLGHWHRPPLALVFERPNGVQLEIGTGSDIWRWEQSLTAGEERGSYKVLHEGGALHVVREPLMTCDRFEPPARQFKLQWYMAWSGAGESRPVAPPRNRTVLEVGTDRKLNWPQSLPDGPCLELNFATFPWPESALRSRTAGDHIRGDRDCLPCWEAGTTRKLARSVIRQLREKCPGGTLVMSGLDPGVCWDGSHVSRPHKDGRLHWDISSLLAFCTWARQTLGEHWTIAAKTRFGAVLPSVRGLFDAYEA